MKGRGFIGESPTSNVLTTKQQKTFGTGFKWSGGSGFLVLNLTSS